MKLNADQINEIKAFISKRGFTYPDVQLEIIDHVASRVEELMEEDKTLLLQHAINLTHAEFGIHGFSVFEDSMIKGLQKKFFKLFLKTFVSFFNWKYLPAIAASVYLIQRLYITINSPQMFVAFGFGGLFLAILVLGIWTDRKYKKYGKLLTMKMGNSYVVVISMLFNIWNIFGVQLGLYKQIGLQTGGLIYGALITFVVLVFFTVETIRQESLATCIELDEKYHLLNA